MKLRELNQHLFAFTSEELAINDKEKQLVALWKSRVVMTMILLFGFSQFYRMKLHK